MNTPTKSEILDWLDAKREGVRQTARAFKTEGDMEYFKNEEMYYKAVKEIVEGSDE